MVCARNVSIHALVKRATNLGAGGDAGGGVSIHALVKRATTYAARGVRVERVSIHALVKRATEKFALGRFLRGFDPRPREEGDSWDMGFTSVGEVFRSTPS